MLIVLQLSEAGTHICCPELYPQITGGDDPPGLLTVSVSKPQSPTLGPSVAAGFGEVSVKGPSRLKVSKSILSLQMSELDLQKVYVQGSLSVVREYAEIIAYELLTLLDDPQEMLKKQQTPKDEAHVPDAVPPKAVHSVDV